MKKAPKGLFYGALVLFTWCPEEDSKTARLLALRFNAATMLC